METLAVKIGGKMILVGKCPIKYWELILIYWFGTSAFYFLRTNKNYGDEYFLAYYILSLLLIALGHYILHLIKPNYRVSISNGAIVLEHKQIRKEFKLSDEQNFEYKEFKYDMNELIFKGSDGLLEITLRPLLKRNILEEIERIDSPESYTKIMKIVGP